MTPQRILIQTTIPYAEDDWNAQRFSLLTEHLRLQGNIVTARDRGTSADIDDDVLVALSRDRFDQLWLFAVDTGDGIRPAECEGISRFRESGGALFVTRDHMDLGSSLCSLAGVGAAHVFHSKQQPGKAEQIVDDNVTTSILWPNFHSGSNGDVQDIDAIRPVHPVLRRSDGSIIVRLPAHPHEGGVRAPMGDRSARVVATGTSKTTGRPFNIAVAFEGGAGLGRAWAESTFHHFADYNWDPGMGCPTFLAEPPSDAIQRDPSLLEDTRTYVANLAAWLTAT